MNAIVNSTNRPGLTLGWKAGLLPGLFVALAHFQSQSHLVPIFGWSFIFWSLAWVVLELSRPGLRFEGDFSIPVWLWIAIGILLAITVARASRLFSVAYLLSATSCALLALATLRKSPPLLQESIWIFLILQLVIAFIGYATIDIGFEDFAPFQVDPETGYTRFRSIALEPNHLGFSLNVIYLVLLFTNNGPSLRFTKQEAVLAVLAIWALNLLTLSPLHVALMSVLTLIYAFSKATLNQRIALIVLVISLVLVGMQFERIEMIISGQDNSANLRTWGALSIAFNQLDYCGALGCGLGAGRSVLSTEELMAEFAAHESLVLPNLFAGALVEGGYPLALFVLLAILAASNILVRRGTINISIFLLLTLCALTGSYPYDAHYWSAVGALFFAERSMNTTVQS